MRADDLVESVIPVAAVASTGDTHADTDADADARDGTVQRSTTHSLAVARRISESLLRIRLASPFFATLAMHARFIEREDIPTAATDGIDVFYNAGFLGAMPSAHLDGVLLHEVLHAALGHVTRRGTRDPRRWNIAADVVVNGLIDQNGFELPDSAVRDEELRDFSVEEIYTLLADREPPDGEPHDDLLERSPSPQSGSGADAPPRGARGDDPGENDAAAQGGEGDGSEESSAHGLSEARRRAIERHWRAAVQQAAAVARGAAHGSLPGGVARAFALDDHPSLDWRTVLWRFLAPTATDFTGFDRRFVHSGLYLETLDDQQLHVAVCVDTSGSIDDDLVAALLGEVQGMLRSYPVLRCQLFYCDAELHGPYELSANDPIPHPVGGGGTDFRPFFAALHDRTGDDAPAVCVYLTDGFGDFPDEDPGIATLWAVTPGGLDDEKFPFGEVLRLH
jgi:predicted metal-dependent peptidase